MTRLMIERRFDYFEWAKEVGAGVRGTSASLERQFDDAAERTEPPVSFDGGR
jgi:hypothetical protein